MLWYFTISNDLLKYKCILNIKISYLGLFFLDTKDCHKRLEAVVNHLQVKELFYQCIYVLH